MITFTRYVCLGIVLTLGLGVKDLLAEVEIAVAIPDFNEGGDSLVHTNGGATAKQGVLRLTKPRNTLSASAYYKLPISLPSSRSFSSYFTFRMTNTKCGDNTDNGADGIALIIQPDLAAQGEYGKGIGYENIADSLAIEFDTHHNTDYNDPANTHVGINVKGNPKSVATAETPFKINDGGIYHAWVDYDGKNDVLEIRLASSNTRPETPLLSHTIDLEKVVGTEGFVGFTAGTGSCVQQHEIFSFYFNTDHSPRGLDTSVESYVAASR